jgi:hypothetical protein
MYDNWSAQIPTSLYMTCLIRPMYDQGKIVSRNVPLVCDDTIPTYTAGLIPGALFMGEGDRQTLEPGAAGLALTDILAGAKALADRLHVPVIIRPQAEDLDFYASGRSPRQAYQKPVELVALNGGSTIGLMNNMGDSEFLE